MTILLKPLNQLEPILILRNDFLGKLDYTDEFLRKRKERQKKKRKRRLIAWFVFLVISMVIVGVILSLTVLFPIKKLTFVGSKIYKPSQIEDVSGIDLEDNLFAISKTDTLNKLKKKLPFVEDIEFERTLPDTLNVKVTDAKRYACYSKNGEYYCVSKSGWVLEKTDTPPENIFLIYSQDAVLKVGNAIEFKKEKTKNQIDSIIKILKDNGLSVDYIDVTNSINLSAGVEGRFEVEFGTEVSIENKVKHLKSMIKQIEPDKTGKIDLSMWNSQKPEGTFVQNSTK